MRRIAAWPGILANYTHSDHADFSESKEEIAPLTEEEKKAKLEELREKLKQKKENQAAAEREEQKRNEVSRRGRPTSVHATGDTDRGSKSG